MKKHNNPITKSISVSKSFSGYRLVRHKSRVWVEDKDGDALCCVSVNYLKQWLGFNGKESRQ